jgi:hypothetical protein
MLTKGDEYPIHQTPEPIAFAGTDRNFYDRYFFCGYRKDGSGYFALAFGVYPHLNIADAHFTILGEDGVQRALHASRLLEMERMNLEVGPVRIEIEAPLRRLRIIVEETHGLAADLVCEGRAFPMEEPRFTRRIGPRMLMDLTRFTQNVRWSGHIDVDGKRSAYAPAASFGTRDRSWGVRPIGASDPQPAAPPQPPQFYWLWAPSNFENLSLFFHVNEDAAGEAWNNRASLALDGDGPLRAIALREPRMNVAWRKGARHAQSARLSCHDPSGRSHEVTWRPLAQIQMKGLGYGHPEWGHGHWKGPLAIAREDLTPAELDPLLFPNLHVQAICAVRHEGPDGLAGDGVGLLEQLVVGPHAPSGFKEILDGAA